MIKPILSIRILYGIFVHISTILIKFSNLHFKKQIPNIQKKMFRYFLKLIFFAASLVFMFLGYCNRSI